MKSTSTSASSSAAPSYLRHPKLARFFRSDGSAARRLRALLSFVQSGSTLDARLFFLDCHSSVFKCVSDAVQQIEAEAAVDGGASDTAAASLLSDSQCVLSALGALMAESPHLIKGRWQLRPIHHILQQALSHYTHIQLRRHALIVLMRLIGTLGSAEEPSLLALLSSAVDFTLFLPASASASQSAFCQLLHSSPCHRPPLLFAWSLPATRRSLAERQADECELLRELLGGTLTHCHANAHTSQHSEHATTPPFAFWLRIVQTHLLPLLYRGLFTSTDSSLLPLGFSPLPPVPLHSCVVDWLLRAAQLDGGSALLPTAASLDSTLALLRLTFLLPPSASACQLQVLAVYEQWLRGEQLPTVLSSKTDELARVVVDHTAALLTCTPASSSGAGDAEADGEELSAGRLSFDDREKARAVNERMEAAHVQACERVLHVWASLCEQRDGSASVTAATCEYVLQAQLRVCDEVVQRSQPLPAVLLHSLLSCLLTSFLSTPADVATSLWEQLQSRLRLWMVRQSAVLESWQDVTRQWTDRLLLALAMDEQQQQQQPPIKGGVSASQQQPGSDPRSTASRATESTFLPFRRTFDRWLILLRLPGSPLSVSSLRVRQAVLAGLHCSLAALLSALQRPRSIAAPAVLGTATVLVVVPRHQLPSCNTLLLLFGSWLVDACLHTLNNAVPLIGQLRQPQLCDSLPAPLAAYSFDGGSEQSSPFSAACLLLCTRRAAPLDSRWVSSLFHVVRLALSSNQTDVLYTVLRNSTQLFSGELDSAHVLLPAFLAAIKRLLAQAAVAERADGSAHGGSSTAAAVRSVFSYTTPSTPLLHDSVGSSHTPLQRRDRTRISLLSDEAEAQLLGDDEAEEDDTEQQWLKQQSSQSATSLDFSQPPPDLATADSSTTPADSRWARQQSDSRREQTPHRPPAIGEDEADSDQLPPVSVRLACLSILHSWLALPFLFRHAAVSQLFPLHSAASQLHAEGRRTLSAAAASVASGATSELTAVRYWSLRAPLLDMLLRSLRYDTSPAVQSACVWGLHLALQLELGDANRRAETATGDADSGHLVCRCLTGLLARCRPSSVATVSHTAIEALRSAVDALSAAPSRRWSRGYDKLRLSLGQPLSQPTDDTEDEQDGDGTPGNERDGSPSQRILSGSQRPADQAVDSDERIRSSIDQQTRSGGGCRERGAKKKQPLLLLVLIDSLCTLATQQLQALTAALSDSYQPLSPPQPSSPSVYRSSDERYSVLAQLVSALLSALLEYAMAFPPLLSPRSALWSSSTCVRARRSLFVLLQYALSLRVEQSALLRDRSQNASAGQRASSFSPSFAAPPALAARPMRSRVNASDMSGAAVRDLTRGTSSPAITPPRKPRHVHTDSAAHSAYSAYQLPAAFVRACDAIEETASALLRRLLTRMQHSPTGRALLGPEQVGAAVCEEEDQGCEEPAEDSRLHVVLDDCSVVTLYHLNGDHSGDTARLVVRDMTGKYAWDVRQVREADAQLTERVAQQRSASAAEKQWLAMQQCSQPASRAPARQKSGRARKEPQRDSSGEEDSDGSTQRAEAGASWRAYEAAHDSEEQQTEEDEDASTEGDSAPSTHSEEEEDERSVSRQLDISREDDEEAQEERGEREDGNRDGRVANEEAVCAEIVRPDLRLVDGLVASAGSGGGGSGVTVLGAPRIDSEGNSSTLYVDWAEVRIVEAFHAPPDSASPRHRKQLSAAEMAAAAGGWDEALEESRRSAKSGGSHLKHFLQVRRRRQELQQQSMERPRSLSHAAAAATMILPPSPALHAVGSADLLSPLLAAGNTAHFNDSVAASDVQSSFPAQSLPSSFSLSPALSAYPAVRKFASDVFFPSHSASQSDSLSERLSTAASFLPDNAKVRRALRLLDRVAVRDTYKVGVLYCARGQDSQRAILANEAGSAAYEQFVAGLGWPVELASHGGFTGGLDAAERSVYFSNSTCELMWHVATRLGSAPLHASADASFDERALLRKKRHVGNDYVHVVWSEHWLDYAADTVSSHFNHVHIVLYPVHSQQQQPLACRVQLFSKPSVPLFGPLQSHMLVPLHALPALVRLTAINANRAIRQSTADYQPPYATRRALLHELIGKAALQSTELHDLTAAVTRQQRDSSQRDGFDSHD